LRYWAIDSGSLNCAKAIIEVHWQWQSAVLKIRNQKRQKLAMCLAFFGLECEEKEEEVDET
jgi:hypothetical protein